VAAELGVSLVPAAMMQLRVTGIVYRQIAVLAFWDISCWLFVGTVQLRP
jgi:hypothetical protein